MNTAVKIKSRKYDKIEQELFQGNGSHKLSPPCKQKEIETLVTGRNERRLRMILIQEEEAPDVFELFGWSELPESLKQVIRKDMESYRDELLGLYSTRDQGVRDRRKSISYWVKAWRDGICSEQTAVKSLSQSISIDQVPW